MNEKCKIVVYDSLTCKAVVENIENMDVYNVCRVCSTTHQKIIKHIL
jgi:hypothetical protein